MYSDTLSLLAAYIPEVPTTITTSIDYQTSTVRFAWVLPSDNGSPITSFKVYVSDNTQSQYILESSDCVGSDPAVISNKYCDVNFATLIASPYNYNGGESVWAKV